jgi:glutathione synthase/RimK-type ligase-like ATP-grasp enzyme
MAAPDTLLGVTDVLLVTSADLPEGEYCGELVVKALADHGLSAAWVCWDDPTVDWSSAGVVAVRSTWDYHGRLAEFLAWAEHVQRWSRLLNGAAAFRWNTDKAYLLDLERAGVPVVPTALLADPDGLAVAAARFPGRVLVKPRVGAGGLGVVVLEDGPDLGLPVTLEPDEGPWVVQPLVESVRTEGELSVFVLDGAPVSQVRKLPVGEEVRVHEEYGGSSEPVELADEAALLATETVAAAQELLGAELSYARVDLLRHGGRLVVSELEITEPGLYLDLVPGNAEPFAAAVAAVLGDPES